MSLDRVDHWLQARASVEPVFARPHDPRTNTPAQAIDTFAATPGERASGGRRQPGEPARPPQGSDPARRLEREWLVLEQGAFAVALPGWRAQQPPLRRFESGRRLLSFLNGARPEETDAPLLALLALAREQRLAGRCVLQAILPALKSRAERIGFEPERAEEVWELLLFFAWEAICGYPVEQRRVRVAANLVLQVLHDTTRELRRLSMRPAGATPRKGALDQANQEGKEPRMRRRIFFAACLYASVTLLVAAPGALAATDINGVIDNLKLWLTGFLASLATVFLITGAARYVMAGGDPVKVEKAKGAISSAGLGFAFALFAPAAVTIIQRIVGG